jgi:hypothetical protein
LTEKPPAATKPPLMKYCDIIEGLSRNYSETWEDEDQMDPSEYDAWLEEQPEEYVLELYNQLYDTEVTIDDLE